MQNNIKINTNILLDLESEELFHHKSKNKSGDEKLDFNMFLQNIIAGEDSDKKQSQANKKAKPGEKAPQLGLDLGKELDLASSNVLNSVAKVPTGNKIALAHMQKLVQKLPVSTATKASFTPKEIVSKNNLELNEPIKLEYSNNQNPAVTKLSDTLISKIKQFIVNLDKENITTSGKDKVLDKETSRDERQGSQIDVNFSNSQKSFETGINLSLQQDNKAAIANLSATKTTTVNITTIKKSITPLIMDALKQGKQNLVIHLEPKNLGSLEIKISMNNNSPSIVINPSQSATKALIAQDLPTLNRLLQQDIPKLSVSILSGQTRHATSFVETVLKNEKRNSKDAKRLADIDDKQILSDHDLFNDTLTGSLF